MVVQAHDAHETNLWCSVKFRLACVDGAKGHIQASGRLLGATH